MSEFSIHFHRELAERLIADRADGARGAASLSRQAMRIVQACGRRIAYAPVTLPNGDCCAMSARGGARGIIVEIDPPGTGIDGRGVVLEREREGGVRRAAPAKRR